MNDSNTRLAIKSLIDFDILAIALSSLLGHAQSLPLLSRTGPKTKRGPTTRPMIHLAACDCSVVRMWVRTLSLTIVPSDLSQKTLTSVVATLPFTLSYLFFSYPSATVVLD